MSSSATSPHLVKQSNDLSHATEASQPPLQPPLTSHVTLPRHDAPNKIVVEATDGWPPLANPRVHDEVTDRLPGL